MKFRKNLDDRLHLQSTTKWLVLSALVGVVAGLGAVAFQAAHQTVSHFALARVAGYDAVEPPGEHALYPRVEQQFSPALLMLVITAGGLASGWLVYTFAPEAEGHGTDAVIDAYHNKEGFIRARIPLVKLVASAITIGTGGSGGREGPIAQIGAGFGSFVGTVLRLSARDRRILLAAGMGAGIGTIFRAPLAGALFAAEILYANEDLESDVVLPAAIASIVGFSVFSLFLPHDRRFLPLFGDGLNYELTSFVEFVPLTVLALVLVVVGVAYIKLFYGTQRWFQSLPIARKLRPMIGAALTGALALALYFGFGRNEHALGVLTGGYGLLDAALHDASKLSAGLLLAVAVGKIATTSLTIGSGGSGGVFGPSIVIGGALGGAVGQTFHAISPELVRQPEVFVLVGMAGLFAGCAHAPISTIVMVTEITGDHRLLLPTMWVSLVCFLLCRPWKLYVNQVPSQAESPAHGAKTPGVS